MDLDQLVSLGFTTAQDGWSWLLMLSMAAKIGSTLALLGLKAGRPWRWVARHEAVLWWTTKLSALAICLCAALLCRAGGDRGGAFFFTALLLVAAMLVVARVRQRRAAR
ncbi:MAG TPA: hypothetical protein VIN03_14695 [Roseateles sp.]